MRRRLAGLLDRLEWHLKLLEAYLIVRDPSAPKSAEAFDGLRVKIDGAHKARHRHIAQLAELDRIVRATDDASVVGARIAEFLQAEGVMAVTEWSPELAEAFEPVSPVGPVMVVHSPAYIDVSESSWSSVKLGTAQADVSVSPEPSDAPRSDDPDDVSPVQEAEEVQGE